MKKMQRREMLAGLGAGLGAGTRLSFGLFHYETKTAGALADEIDFWVTFQRNFQSAVSPRSIPPKTEKNLS